MTLKNVSMTLALAALLAGCAAGTSTGTSGRVATVPADVPAIESNVARQGYFYVGGRYVGEPGHGTQERQAPFKVTASRPMCRYPSTPPLRQPRRSEPGVDLRMRQSMRSATLKKLWLSCIAAWCLCAGCAFAQQNYPTKPIRLIVPYPPGGGSEGRDHAPAAPRLSSRSLRRRVKRSASS